jgi:hypothetical protein
VALDLKGEPNSEKTDEKVSKLNARVRCIVIGAAQMTTLVSRHE